MKIETEAQDMTEQQKRHAFKILSEMLHSINTIEESFVYFCSDEENKVLSEKLIEKFKEDKAFDGTMEEPLIYLSLFKAKIMSEHKRLNTSINKLN
jgi:hypothetical protein